MQVCCIFRQHLGEAHSKGCYVPMVPGGDEKLLHILCSVALVKLDGCTLQPSTSALDEYHIPRVLSQVTSKNLVLGRSSDKNIHFFKFAPENWSIVLYKPFSCFCFLFQLFTQKTLKNHILTSIWGAQHPNTGQNIQQKS